VFTDALILRLSLQGRRATGVSIHRHGQEETLFSEREIILAAGAYGSPRILMLSGIGPADELAGPPDDRFRSRSTQFRIEGVQGYDQ
jgi:choline dehydrogenase-like flavoprotein